jgi:hypothetical protein
VQSLAQATRQNSKVFLMCFSEREPGEAGPRRIRQEELRDAFSEGWSIESIRATQFEVNPHAEQTFVDGGPQAWFAVIRRSVSTDT